MKTIKQVITVVIITVFTFTSFIAKAQDKYKDAGKWHNIVLSELQKSDSKAKLNHLKNPSIVFNEIIKILVQSDSKLFNKKELDSKLPEMLNYAKDIAIGENMLSNLIYSLKSKVSQGFYNKLVKIADCKNGDILQHVESIRKYDFSDSDKIYVALFLDVFDSSTIFWQQGVHNKVAFSWGKVAADAAGALIGSASSAGFMGFAMGVYVSHMYDIYNAL